MGGKRGGRLTLTMCRIVTPWPGQKLGDEMLLESESTSAMPPKPAWAGRDSPTRVYGAQR